MSEQWIIEWQPGSQWDAEAFFNSRTVFYPGSGFDGQPVATFNGTSQISQFIGKVSCFLYVDYGISQEAVEAELAHPERGFRGYHRIDRVRLSQRDLCPRGWQAHLHPPHAPATARSAIEPYAFLDILERDEEVGSTHGQERIAVLFLAADGIAAFDALYCQDRYNRPAPLCVVLQDHGFGGNYDSFGGGGLLSQLAHQTSRLPNYLLVADHTPPWHGYAQCSSVSAVIGGQHGNVRRLYERIARTKQDSPP